MGSIIFLVLQAFYFAWAITQGVNMVDASSFAGFMLLVLPNAVLTAVYGGFKRNER